MNTKNTGFNIEDFVNESAAIILIEKDFDNEKVKFKTPMEAFSHMSNHTGKKAMKIIFMRVKDSAIKSVSKKRYGSKAFKKLFFDSNVKIKYIGKPSLNKAKNNYVTNIIINIILNKKNGFFIGSSKEIVRDKYKSRLESKRVKVCFK